MDADFRRVMHSNGVSAPIWDGPPGGGQSEAASRSFRVGGTMVVGAMGGAGAYSSPEEIPLCFSLAEKRAPGVSRISASRMKSVAGVTSVDKEQVQAEINRQVGSHVPRRGWNVTVSIVLANRPAVHPIGTGSLFEIGGYRFVVTAAHVLDEAHQNGKTIGISDGGESFVSVHGNWIRSASLQSGEQDPFDIAVYKLPLTLLRS
jgi:hypothetical protein